VKTDFDKTEFAVARTVC